MASTLSAGPPKDRIMDSGSESVAPSYIAAYQSESDSDG